MGDIVRVQSNDTAFFRPKDIYNDRQHIRQTTLQGLTATQRWIAILEEQGFHHTVQYVENKVKAVFWTYPWCITMWKMFPQVLGMDNTYKTNRFKMYLFQVSGITDQKSAANFTFGLTDTEKEVGYDWLCGQIDSLRGQLGIPTPDVVITDKEMALKNSLQSFSPQTQQQLCIFHINANVKGKINLR